MWRKLFVPRSKEWYNQCYGKFSTRRGWNVKIDGLPSSKSSKLQLLPILGSFYESNILVVALLFATPKLDHDFMIF